MILLEKASVGLCCIVFSFILLRYSPFQKTDDGRFFRWMMVLWAVSRVGLFVAMFLVAGYTVPSDASGIYFPQAQKAGEGLLVYRDFYSSYAPLFPYFLVLFLKAVWNSPVMIVLLTVLIDGAGFWAWIAVARQEYPSPNARLATLLYVTNALPLYNVAVEGQNQIWISTLIGWALWLAIRRRWSLSAIVLSVPFVLVKFLAVISVPPFLSIRKQWRRYLIVFIILPALVYGVLSAAGVDIFTPLRGESHDRSSGNLPYLLNGLLSVFHKPIPVVVFDIITAILLAALSLYCLGRDEAWSTRSTVSRMVLILLTLLIFSKKSYTSYLAIEFFPLCLVAASRASGVADAVLFGIFGALATVERSLYFRWFGAKPLEQISVTGSALPTVAAIVAVDLILIAFYGYYWMAAWRAQATAEGPREPGGR